jgi:prepilin-type N-terminal cleavage/methylation domain-containing protein
MDFFVFCRYKKNGKKGFTLIELLVVIAIIGLLSSVVIASLANAREKARYAKSQTELNQIIKAAVIAQGESGKRLQDITGSGCSDCVCRNKDIRNIPESDSCYIQWVNALNTIQNATVGSISGIVAMTRDPWGSPYGLDENEREGGPTDCRMDTIRSAGPDGILYTTDDQGYVIPLSKLCP